MCYLKKIDNQEELFDYSVFVPALVMFVIFVSFDSNPYWFVYLAPFFAIMLAYNSGSFNQLILFETIGGVCLILSQYGGNYWIYDTAYAKGMALEYIFGEPKSLISLEKFNSYTRLDSYYTLFFAVFMVCMSTVLYLSRPKKCRKNDSVSMRKYSLIRLVVNAGVAMIPIAVYLISFIITLQ
jgi:hypothetical protein